MPENAYQQKRWVIKYESGKDPGNDFEFPENSSRNDKKCSKGMNTKVLSSYLLCVNMFGVPFSILDAVLN